MAARCAGFELVLSYPVRDTVQRASDALQNRAMNILLTPARIGPAEIPNRIVMPAMTTRASDEEGHVTEQTIAYYMARVRGGTGLITVEMASPEKAGRHRRRELGVYDDKFLPGLTRLVREIHAGGGKASIQLGHGGGHTRIDICGETPIAPSAVPHPVYETTFETIIPQAMSKQRIAQTTAAYVAAAARVRDAGFDCVEIHAAHGYLISQFHAPFENRRTDEYGGSLANRARFGLDVLRAVKAAAPELGVIYRLSIDDFFEGGVTADEGLTIARWAAQAGADALHVTAGHYRSKPTAHRMIPPMTEPDATFLALAARVKASVTIPVIAVGRLGEPATATAAVESGKADFIALGRTLVADPQWVEKLRRDEPIRRCLACNTCVDGMRGGAGISCVVNGAAGRETRYGKARPQHGERIAVIGAGPAGLTYASLVAAGNAVTVFEKTASAGGAFRYAGRAPMFNDVAAVQESFDRYVAGMVAACERKGVTFRFSTDVTRAPDLLASFDRIVIATGADYRFALGPLAMAMLNLGAGHWPGVAQALSMPKLRDWFYYRARQGNAARFKALVKPAQHVAVIGDAVKAGKSKEAIASAFDAALLDS
jgi:2,4-dienoyl-CoA reductase-like NADH-dependent reductase (Old Yellow Enzyme family)